MRLCLKLRQLRDFLLVKTLVFAGIRLLEPSYGKDLVGSGFQHVLKRNSNCINFFYCVYKSAECRYMGYYSPELSSTFSLFFPPSI